MYLNLVLVSFSTGDLGFIPSAWDCDGSVIRVKYIVAMLSIFCLIQLFFVNSGPLFKLAKLQLQLFFVGSGPLFKLATLQSGPTWWFNREPRPYVGML